MIRVTIEVIPFGAESERRLLGQLTLTNNLSSNDIEHGNYDIEGRIMAGSGDTPSDKYWQIINFDRSGGWLSLVKMVVDGWHRRVHGS